MTGRRVYVVLMPKRDSVRDNAIARRDAALAEARRWEEFLALYDELGPGGRIAGQPSSQSQGLSEHTTSPQIGSRVTETEDRARGILLQAGRPLTTKELLSKLEATGFAIRGQNPVATLHTRLNRSASLVFVRPVGWQVREDAETIGATSPATAMARPVAPSLPLVDADRRGGDHDAS